jgi:hypothetical protein
MNDSMEVRMSLGSDISQTLKRATSVCPMGRFKRHAVKPFSNGCDSVGDDGMSGCQVGE